MRRSLFARAAVVAALLAAAVAPASAAPIVTSGCNQSPYVCTFDFGCDALLCFQIQNWPRHTDGTPNSGYTAQANAFFGFTNSALYGGVINPNLPGALAVTFAYGPCASSIPCETFTRTIAIPYPAWYASLATLELTPELPVTDAVVPPYVTFAGYHFSNAALDVTGLPVGRSFTLIPEPTTLALSIVGLLGCGVALRRKRTAQAARA